MSKPKAMQSFDLIEVGEDSVYLNGNKAPRNLQKIGVDLPLHSFIDSPSQCPFCHSNLVTCGNLDFSDFYYGRNDKEYRLWYCRYCRFWQWYYYFDVYGDG
ncbi:MAG TPA: hypothetical protein VF634_08845, partial [Pyrinomonadaceae bacterium]